MQFPNKIPRTLVICTLYTYSIFIRTLFVNVWQGSQCEQTRSEWMWNGLVSRARHIFVLSVWPLLQFCCFESELFSFHKIKIPLFNAIHRYSNNVYVNTNREICSNTSYVYVMFLFFGFLFHTLIILRFGVWIRFVACFSHWLQIAVHFLFYFPVYE